MGISAHDQEIQSLVNNINEGRLLLPELQRGYVWKSTQVRDLFDSLYHQYPTGQILVWQTDDVPHAQTAAVQGIERGSVQPLLLLDGQQRLTSLAAVLLGQPLQVRDRTRTRDLDVAFNVFDEKFEVATAFHHPQAGWISLRKLFTKGSMAVLTDLKIEFSDPNAQTVHDRLTRLESIRHYRYRVNLLEGLVYDEVTHIFVRINSGGTRLSSADLALAQISSRWRGVTEPLDEYRSQAKHLGWELDYSVLLRVLTAVLTGQSRFSRLFKAGRGGLTVNELKSAWSRAVPAMDSAIQFLIHNCGIDRLSMMPTYYPLIPLTVFFDKHGGGVSEKQVRDLRRWLYMALIWSRYTGAAETFLDEDLAALARDDQPILRMIQNIEDKVGHDRVVTERELQDQLSNTPFMLMAYILARRNHAQDWFNGVVIGGGQQLEYHHIFPKAVLSGRYDLRAQSRLINQVANLAFLSQRANGKIAASPPTEYLPSLDQTRLRMQYVPSDPMLWELDRYEDFVRARREQLATAINDLLASLMDAPTTQVSDGLKRLEARITAAEQDLRDLIDQRLTTNFGPRAWKQCVTGDIQDQVRQRIEQRIRRNPFEEGHYDALAEKLTQCNFGDYAKIMRSNWALFEDVFRDKTTFDRQMVAVQDARNAFAHRRVMNEGEQQTAAGSLYWIEQCLRQAARLEPEEEVNGEGEGDLVGVTIADHER